MSQAKYRKKEFFQGAYYHTYNRGVNKEPIFLDDDDFIYYIIKLRQFKDKYKVDIIFYCLLNNHYHQLLNQLSEIPVSKFLLAVNTSYGGYFNKKYKRVGPLMQDRFKQSVIRSDAHFNAMSVYVNCNYEIHGLGKARDYRWSSYQDYIGLRNGTFCNKNKIIIQFKTGKEYEEFCDRLIAEFQEKKIAKMEQRS
ncbi:MAG: transposase [Patescibacteria group bacterium]|nr:transposase [Patescibacteria group bacterium]